MPEEKLNKILATVVYLRDKIDNELPTKQEIGVLEDKLLTHIDSFVKLHQTLDQELVSLRHKYDRLEDRVKIVEEKLEVEAK